MKELLLKTRILKAYSSLRNSKNAIGSYVDLKTLFRTIEGTKSLKTYKFTLIEMARKNPQYHLSLAPELVVDRRYAICSDRGWLYGFSIQSHMPKSWKT